MNPQCIPSLCVKWGGKQVINGKWEQQRHFTNLRSDTFRAVTMVSLSLLIAEGSI